MSTDSFLFFRQFRLRIILRLCVIGAILVATTLMYLRFENYVWLIAGGLLLVWQVNRLFSSLERVTRDLTSFLEAIQYSDFTLSFRSPFSDKIFNNLYHSFGNVMDSFHETRSQSEAQRRYFETLIHHVGIGLMCYHPNGEVKLINNAAKRLLDKPALLDINDLQPYSENLTQSLLAMDTGEHRLVQVNTELEQLQLSVHATRFTLHNDEYILVSLQNINSQLEDSEMEAMQHMSRVLAHEIMNSMTPIVSLASLAQDHLQEQVALLNDVDNQESMEDLFQALETIEKRSEGLLHFVNAYRSITRIPHPDTRLIPVQELLARITNLFDVQLNQKEVNVSLNVSPPELSVLADPDLIEQVLINLIKNAIEAFEDSQNRQLILEGLLDRQGRVLIQVTDNGPGIPPGIIENIFVPFFSTKATGSGIGLSFSRHVMRRHKGVLLLQSKEGGPTTFTLRF